jgi:putative endonuclease
VPYFAYVIYSQSHNKFYKGHCEDLIKRLAQHNNGKTKSTKAFAPWKIVYYESFETREQAINREKYFKTAAGRRFLKKVIR